MYVELEQAALGPTAVAAAATDAAHAADAVRVEGTQFVGDFEGCQCDASLMRRADLLELLCEQAVWKSGLCPVGRNFHQFESGGATGVVLLAESHLAVHTWPEKDFVSVDLYVCNFNADNRGKAAALFAALKEGFQPRVANERVIVRGATQDAAA